MQATLDGYSLKPFTKALTCLSKYGDDLSIFATPDSLSLSATNSSMSAYCRFKYSSHFFSKFNVGTRQRDRGGRMMLADEVEEIATVTGQLLAKPLLSILKHRTVDKSVDRCELSIVEGASPSDDEEREEDSEERDALESRLIVRLYCKHGVVKTHRLLLLTPTSLMAPGVPSVPYESRITIGPRAIKDMIEHFPSARGAKSDPQLIWTFGESEVELKNLESSIDSKGKAQLATELTISTDEFDTYDIHSPPVTIAFHLREFNATIAFAESTSLPLDLRFTDPSAPLFIDIEGDNSETLFVISTSHVHGGTSSSALTRQADPAAATTRKRDRGADSPRAKKPMKAVQRADPADLARAAQSSSSGGQFRSQSGVPARSMPPPSLPPPTNRQKEPLFLPGSQASIANSQTLRESGLGIEDMGPEELSQMMEAEGVEVGLGMGNDDDFYDRPDSFELVDVDDPELAPTQSRNGSSGHSKTFRPLFQD